MAIFWEAAAPPDAVTAFIREVPFGANLGLSNLFGRRDLEGDTIDFAEITQTNRVARYRSWDGRIHVSQRDTGSEGRVRMIPLSSSLNQGEYERLRRRFTELGGSPNAQRLEQAVYNDATQLTREVQNRIELAWGDVLADGILTISEGGLTGSAGIVDYGVPAGQKLTVGTTWATTTAPALSDMATAVDQYVDANGFAPGFILTSTAQRRNMRKNAEIINAIGGSAAGRTRVSDAELGDLLSSELQGVTLLDPYDNNLDVDGVTTRTLPADKVIFLPPNLDDLGYTAWGTTVTALELVNSAKSELSFQQAPGIVGMVVKEGPPFREFTFVDALAMPVLTNAKLMTILDVVP